MGLGELADLYASDNRILINAIRQTGMQLTCERDTSCKRWSTPLFVRLSQEAAARHCYIALQQVLTSLEAVDNQRPRRRWPSARASASKSASRNFSTKAIREDQFPEGLPRSSAPDARSRQSRKSRRASIAPGIAFRMTVSANSARAGGPEVTVRLNETLRVGPPVVAVEAAKLLSAWTRPPSSSGFRRAFLSGRSARKIACCACWPLRERPNVACCSSRCIAPSIR